MPTRVVLKQIKTLCNGNELLHKYTDSEDNDLE